MSSIKRRSAQTTSRIGRTVSSSRGSTTKSSLGDCVCRLNARVSLPPGPSAAGNAHRDRSPSKETRAPPAKARIIAIRSPGLSRATIQYRSLAGSPPSPRSRSHGRAFARARGFAGLSPLAPPLAAAAIATIASRRAVPLGGFLGLAIGARDLLAGGLVDDLHREANLAAVVEAEQLDVDLLAL